MLLKKYSLLLFVFVLATLLIQCSQSDAEEVVIEKFDIPEKSVNNQLSVHSALPRTVNYPKDNLPSDAKIKLGKLLFYDPILSGNKDVSCVTCHHPKTGYAEYRDLSIGVNGKGLGANRSFRQPNQIPLMKRNAHTILNTAFNGINTSNMYRPDDAPMFWDLRVSSLEKQALEPILTLEEMRGTHFEESEILDVIVERLKRIPEYAALFESVFDEPDPINSVNIAKAIAAFERTLNTSETRFDKYMRGDKTAISIAEKEGYRLFKKVGCANCHNGPMFSDYLPHIIGVPKNQKLSEFDTGIDGDYAFRTPSLRNLQFTAPYMHNGQFNTLKEVLEFYEDISNGKNIHVDVVRKDLDSLINKIDLSVKEIGPIVSFFNTLSDSNFDKEIPTSVPSGLPVGGNIGQHDKHNQRIK